VGQIEISVLGKDGTKNKSQDLLLRILEQGTRKADWKRGTNLASSRHMETPRLGLGRKRDPPGGEGALGSVRAAHRHGLRERRRGAQVPARDRDAAVAAQSVSHGYTELVLPGTKARTEQR
jgi:hypothetical protein